MQKNLLKTTFLMGLALTVANPLKAGEFDPAEYWKTIVAGAAGVSFVVGWAAKHIWSGESIAAREQRLKREQAAEAEKRKGTAKIELQKIVKDLDCELEIAKVRELNREEIQKLVNGYAEDDGLTHKNCARDLSLKRKKLSTLLSDLPEKKRKTAEETRQLIKKMQQGHGQFFKEEIVGEAKIRKELDLQDAKIGAQRAEMHASEAQEAAVRGIRADANQRMKEIVEQAQIFQLDTEVRITALSEKIEREYREKGVTGISNRLKDVEQSLKELQNDRRLVLDAIIQSNHENRQNHGNHGGLTRDDLKKLEEKWNKRLDTLELTLANIAAAVGDNQQNDLPLSGGVPSAPPAGYLGYPKL